MLETADPIGIHAQAATLQAFELMCFTELTPLPEPEAVTGERLVAQVDFDGNIGGRLRMELPAAAANAIAANFFGDDGNERSASQVQSLVCELTNIICGSLLSQLNPASVVVLSTPELYTTAEGSALGTSYSFRLDEWPVRISMAWSSPEERVA